MPIFDLNSPPQPPATPADPLPPEPSAERVIVAPGTRYHGLEHHEILSLLDDMEDERARSRRREAFYVSTIVYLLLAWFIFYGPQILWHAPRMINPGDALKDRDLTYLDLPPDALQHLKPKTPPRALSDKERVANTPDRKTLDKLRAQEPAAPPPPAQQSELPAAPQPQSPPPAPQPTIAEAPTPNRPTFTPPATSAGDNLRNLANNAIPTRPGLSGSYGNTPFAHRGGGLAAPVEVLSDTSGADIDPYIRHLLADLKAHWLPLIPEEAYPPLSKQGETMIRFTISPDGKLLAMNLDDSTHDLALDHAAWGSIVSVGQFQPLPKGMKDPNLTLRIRFMVNEPLE